MKGTSAFTPVFASRLAPAFRSVCGSEAGFGAAFRSSSPHAAIRGSVPLRPKRRVLGPECCRVSGVVSHPRTRYFGSSAGSHAGGSELLLVSPPDRAAVLRSGPQLLSALPATAAEYALEIRDQNGLGEPRRIILGHPPAFPYAPRNCNLHADSGYFAAIFSDSFSIW